MTTQMGNLIRKIFGVDDEQPQYLTVWTKDIIGDFTIQHPLFIASSLAGAMQMRELLTSYAREVLKIEPTLEIVQAIVDGTVMPHVHAELRPPNFVDTLDIAVIRGIGYSTVLVQNPQDICEGTLRL